jgi:hypothetical protein
MEVLGWAVLRLGCVEGQIRVKQCKYSKTTDRAFQSRFNVGQECGDRLAGSSPDVIILSSGNLRIDDNLELEAGAVHSQKMERVCISR